MTPLEWLQETEARALATGRVCPVHRIILEAGQQCSVCLRESMVKRKGV